MGNTRSANGMSAILIKLAARNVVVIGIAGSLVEELHLGTVGAGVEDVQNASSSRFYVRRRFFISGEVN